LIRPEEGPSEPDANIERIIVPIDGSELSGSAVPYAGELARALGATVMAVHVITPFAITYPGTEAYVDQRVMDQLEASAKEMLLSAGDRLRAMGLTAEQLLTRGTPTDGIISAAIERRADLIVMSTHGRSGMGRWVMGSVADAVVRRSHLPCLLRRPEEAQPGANV
jgi:nucleotide-binding universal stress UspA family protein